MQHKTAGLLYDHLTANGNWSSGSVTSFHTTTENGTVTRHAPSWNHKLPGHFSLQHDNVSRTGMCCTSYQHCMIQNEHHHLQIIQNTILQTLKQGFWKSRGLVFHWNENTQYGLIFCSSALIDYDLHGGPHGRSRASCTILYHRHSLSKSCMAAIDQFQSR